MQRRAIEAPRGSQHELLEGGSAANNVTPDQVLVPALHICGTRRCFGEHAIAESWRKALDLRGNLSCHRAWPAVRDMAVGPNRVLARGSACRIEQAGLR